MRFRKPEIKTTASSRGFSLRTHARAQCLAIFLLVTLAPLNGEATNVTGTIQRPDGTPVTGTIEFVLSQAAKTTTPPLLFAPVRTTCAVTNGVIAAGCTVQGNDTLDPAGTYYTVRVVDSNNRVVVPAANYTIAGASVDLGALPVTATATLVPPSGNVVGNLNVTGNLTVGGSASVPSVDLAASHLRLLGLTADPATSTDGSIFHRSDLNRIRIRAQGVQLFDGTDFLDINSSQPNTVDINANLKVGGSTQLGTSADLSCGSTAPANPSSGSSRVYCLTGDKRLYLKNDSGTVFGPLGSLNQAQTWTATQSVANLEVLDGGSVEWINATQSGNNIRFTFHTNAGPVFQQQGANQNSYINVAPKGTGEAQGAGTAKALFRVWGTDVVADSANAESVDIEAQKLLESSNRVALTSIVRAANVVTVTTTTAHTTIASDTIVIAGTTDGGTGTSFNGTFTVATAPTSTTLTFAQTGADGTAGIGAATFGVERPAYYVAKTRQLGTGRHRPVIFQAGGFNLLYLDPVTGSISTAPYNLTAGIAVTDGAGRGDVILGHEGASFRSINVAATSTVALLKRGTANRAFLDPDSNGIHLGGAVFNRANNTGVAIQAGPGLFNPAVVLNNSSGVAKGYFGLASTTNDWVTGTAASDIVLSSPGQNLFIRTTAADSFTAKFDTSGVSGISVLSSLAADPADAGFARLANAETICWEASPAGTDVCISVDASEVVQITGGFLDGADLASGSVTATQLGTDSVGSDELDAAGVEAELEGVLDLPDLQGTLTVSKGGTGAAPGADDQALISDSTSAATWRAIPNCNTENMLTYNTSTNSFGCEADDGGGGGGDNITVNGTAATNADLDDATPAAPANAVNVKWQKDSSAPDNISAHLLLTDIDGAGIAVSGTELVTASSEENFLAAGALTCGAGTRGRIQIHTTPLQYCDNAATPALQYTAYADSTGKASIALDLQALSSVVSNAEVDNDITLDNITQITTRSHTSLSDIGTNTHATIDTHIAATAAHGATGAVVGTTNVQTLDSKTIDGKLATTTHAAGANFLSSLRHATDCTAITDGVDGEFCWEADANTIYVCEPSAGGCDTAGEWTKITDNDSGGSPAWNALVNSADTATSYLSNNTAEMVTFSFESAFTTGTQFLVRQQTGLATGGTLFGITAADADVTPFTAGTSGGEAFRVNKDAFVGIGTAALSGGVPLTLLQMVAASGPQFTLTTAGTGGLVVGQRSAGTVGSPTAATSGLNTLILHGQGYGATAFKDVAGIRMQTAETISDTSSAGTLLFYTTATGSTTLTERARFLSNGNFGIGTDAPDSILHVNGDIAFKGAGGASRFVLTGTPTGVRTITAFDATDTLVGKATTDTLTNKTLDVEGTGNSITTVSKITLVAAGCNNATAGPGFDLPTANAPAPACLGTSPHRFGSLDFSDGATQTGVTHFRLPSDWTGNTDVVFLYTGDTASSNNIRWQASSACVADSEDVLNPTYNTASASNSAGPTTAGQRKSASFPAVSMTNCAAGETAFWKFERVGGDAGDTYTGMGRLLEVEITLRRAQ